MIIYTSKHGAVREFVESCARSGANDVFDVAVDRRRIQESLESLPPTRICVCAPVYAGRIPGTMRRFLQYNREAIERHEVALALSCLYEGDEAREQLVTVFPDWLVSTVPRTFLIGGRIRRTELSAPMRFLMGKMMGQNEDIDMMRDDLVPEIVSWLTYKTDDAASS
jgi:menaquinone-dependent protoporphyrinogen oxidase